MKLNDVITESYMRGLEVPLPILSTRPGLATVLSELAGTQVKETKLGAKLFLIYVGKRPARKEIANMIASKYNVSFEKALSLVPGE